MRTLGGYEGYRRKAMKRLSLLVILAAGLSSCTARDYATDNRADVILRVLSVTGAAGGASAGTSEFLLSDVLTNGGVINDNATIETEAVPKNPLLGEDLPPANDIFLTRYTVQYLRSDGRNVEGVDVPYAISGSLSDQVDIGGLTNTSIVIVRHQAKLEPPLMNLGNVSGSLVLTTTAKITVYGKTTSGKDVSTVCYLEITFADFPDA